jgi:signal transduction histidine kinase
LLRTGRRALVESLYLLTGPVIAAAGLLLVPVALIAALLAGLAAFLVAAVVAARPGSRAATTARARPGASPVTAAALAPARWAADLERWRIALVRPRDARQPGRRPELSTAAALSDPGLWLDVAHTVTALPVVLVTALVTFAWWWVGLATITFPLRNAPSSYAVARPMILDTGRGPSRVFLSLGLSPSAHVAFAVTVGVVALAALPLVTRAATAVQAGLGRALLWDMSALHRRIRGLEQERDTARAQTVAAVAAEADGLRRLERDLHDGPQQRLVRLALELGRAQRHFDARPEIVREALADAIVQAQEALEELRALSRGIAPPILADRGLPAALTALAARSAVPAALDLGLPSRSRDDGRERDRGHGRGHDRERGPGHGQEPRQQNRQQRNRQQRNRQQRNRQRQHSHECRLDAAVETAAYFVVAEALTNVAKHSGARQCTVGLRHEQASLRVWVTDDGAGGAALAKGHGLRGLEDRLHAAGGRLLVTSPAGGPTTVEAELPCR